MAERAPADLDPGRFLRPLRRHGGALLIILALALVGGLAHLLLAPRAWTVRVSILPPLDKGWELPLGGLSETAALGLLPLLGGSADPGLLAPEVLLSDRLLRKVLLEEDPAYGGGSLASFLGEEDAPAEDGVRRLRRAIAVHRSGRTGLIEVALTLGDPAAAEHLASRLLEELDEFWRSSTSTRAAEVHAFLDARLQEVGSALGRAEEALTAFRSANRSLGDSPVLRQEEARLQRESLLQETLYIELHRQAEMARVQELRDLPVLRVLDPPRRPSRPSSPRPATSLVGAGLLGLLAGLGYAYGRDLLVPSWRRWLQED